MTETLADVDTAAGVLGFVRGRRESADRAEAELLQGAVAWAGMHSTESLADAATITDRCFLEESLPIAGPGAPLIAEFSITEFAVAVGLSTEAGKSYLGEAVELRYRLPRVWKRVAAGDLVAWKARWIAKATLSLSMEAARFVDARVAAFAHRLRVSELDRLVETAIAQFMPEEAERRRKAAADGRSFNVGKSRTGLDGNADVWGTLDVADALDLDAAVAEGAEALKTLGSTESLDVRRAQALGAIARRQLAFDLNGTDEETPAPARNPRQVILHVHLSEAAIRGEAGGLGRFENTRTPITAEQIRQWCGNPDAQVIVKPIIDLNDHHHVNAYEVPDRIREQSALITQTCVFPWCTRSARRCDSDHIEPYDSGGTTSSDNIAPLCRRHHRLKTHGGWRYARIEAGSYVWTSPHGYTYLRDQSGTLDVSRDQRPPPTEPPDRRA